MNPLEQTCYIALGGNEGNVAETFQQALHDLNQSPDIRLCQVSQFYRTESVGTEAGETYLNAAAELSTTLSPLDLLHALQQIEAQFGRTRPYRWAPRTLDLDLIFYGQQVFQSDELTIPHPATFYRRFVLKPLTDIAPNFLHPTINKTIAELQSQTEATPYRVAVYGNSLSHTKLWIEETSELFPGVELLFIDESEELNLAPHLKVALSETAHLRGESIHLRETEPDMVSLQNVPPEKQKTAFFDTLTAARGHIDPV